MIQNIIVLSLQIHTESHMNNKHIIIYRSLTEKLGSGTRGGYYEHSCYA